MYIYMYNVLIQTVHDCYIAKHTRKWQKWTNKKICTTKQIQQNNACSWINNMQSTYDNRVIVECEAQNAFEYFLLFSADHSSTIAPNGQKWLRKKEARDCNSCSARSIWIFVVVYVCACVCVSFITVTHLSKSSNGRKPFHFILILSNLILDGFSLFSWCFVHRKFICPFFGCS